MTAGAAVSLLTAAALLACGVRYATADAPPTRADRLAAQLVKEREVHRAVVRRVRVLERVVRHQPSVQEALTLASVVYQVPRGELSAVAWCESTHRPWARNGQYRGLLQLGPIFNSTPYRGLDVYSPYVNVLAGAYIWRSGGRSWAPWQCSPRGEFRP